MRHTMGFIGRQVVLIGLAALAYFGVRGLTEADLARANRNAANVLDLERALSIDIELGLQSALLDNQRLVDFANWIYIWGHWPVVAATLVWLATAHRRDFYELRNAMFISGAIGLVIYASYAVAPPRLFSPEFIDTVTENSNSYRVLQPPNLVNKYAAVPSLHFGWNLLVGLSWYKVGRNRLITVAAVLMPMAMAFAVVATANHWTFDVFAGGVVALSGLMLERARQRRVTRLASVEAEPSVETEPPVQTELSVEAAAESRTTAVTAETRPTSSRPEHGTAALRSAGPPTPSRGECQGYPYS